MIAYYLERSGGQWCGQWHSKDEGKTYRRKWHSVGECEKWCKDNEFEFVLVK